MLIRLILVVLIMLPFFGQAQQFHFKKYSLEEGLPRVGVYDIFQDYNGFIWVGTEGGGVCSFEDVRKPEERKNAANCEIHQYETTEAGIFFRSHRAWRGNPGSVEERPVETIASEWLLIAPTMNQH